MADTPKRTLSDKTRPKTQKLPDVRPLSKILSKGSEGGKEFARIVDLLLFHDARQRGEAITLFDDASGDFFSLDSFATTRLRKTGKTGYQYKFFPSPLSNAHRGRIKKTLQAAIDQQKEANLASWILVTPDDFTNHSRRKGGGDVTWFEQLIDTLNPPFSVSHWGHKNLQDLFLQNLPLCYFYYPELAQALTQGLANPEAIRAAYFNNLPVLYGDIQFVGMGVFKQEATKGIPLEHIYIPLEIQPIEGVQIRSSRKDPLEICKTAGISVVLGDPGSGKSTLMKFLALAGSQKKVRKRSTAKASDRFPVLIVLRKYAETLTHDPSTDLLEYIFRTLKADFSIPSMEKLFLQSQLEAGSALLLFDGLDELANPELKATVKDRIRTLYNTYPGNAFVVSSRIVGYDHPFRFDDAKHQHYQVAPLNQAQMEQFIRDWYTHKIKNPHERKKYIEDLLKIIGDASQEAIFRMAQNPLLLTIMTLVHRIDAVLPDQRVVLYQKCTEAMLCSWHNWKFKKGDKCLSTRGRERRYRHRMEAIAWHMQNRLNEDRVQKAVIPHASLLKFLTQYIADNEQPTIEQDHPEDVAEDFLKFVKERAGLLVEVGDRMFSFVHLTFQEYLAATFLKRDVLQESGKKEAFKYLQIRCKQATWNETIRLFIADLENDRVQQYFCEAFIETYKNTADFETAILLGGLLLDKVESLQILVSDILEILYLEALRAPDRESLQALLKYISTWREKHHNQLALEDQAFLRIWQTWAGEKTDLGLLTHAASWEPTRLDRLTSNWAEKYRKGWYAILIGDKPKVRLTKEMNLQWDELWQRAVYRNFISLFGCFQSTGLFGVFNSRACQELAWDRLFHSALQYFRYGLMNIQFIYQLSYFGLFSPDKTRSYTFSRKSYSELNLDRALTKARARARARKITKHLNLKFALEKDLERTRKKDMDLRREVTLGREFSLSLDQILGQTWDLALGRGMRGTRLRDRYHYLVYFLTSDRNPVGNRFLATIKTNEVYLSPLVDDLIHALELPCQALWQEVLQSKLWQKIESGMTIFDDKQITLLKTGLRDGTSDAVIHYHAAILLFVDAWLSLFLEKPDPQCSLFGDIAALSKDSSAPALRIAHRLRDVVYGGEAQVKEFKRMLDSEDPAYRDIFVHSMWREA